MVQVLLYMLIISHQVTKFCFITGEEEWYTCSLCTFQTKKKKAILSHGCTDHNITKPFCCSICKYESATDTIFRSHFKNCHPKEGDSCKVITFYRKVRMDFKFSYSTLKNIKTSNHNITRLTYYLCMCAIIIHMYLYFSVN